MHAHQHPLLPGGKEGQIFIQTSDQPQATEHLYPEGTFQDGGGQYNQKPTAARGLDVLFGSQGCLSCSPNCQRAPQVSLFPVEWQNFRIHMPPIWPLQCPSCFHETPAPSDGLFVLSGYANYHLPRRHPSDASGQDNTLARSGVDVQLTGSTGVHNQPTQITDCSGTTNSILGIYSGFQSDEVVASSRETRQHCTDLPEPEETTTDFSSLTVSTTRENDSGSPSSSLSSNTILTLTTAENTIIEML